MMILWKSLCSYEEFKQPAPRVRVKKKHILRYPQIFVCLHKERAGEESLESIDTQMYLNASSCLSLSFGWGQPSCVACEDSSSSYEESDEDRTSWVSCVCDPFFLHCFKATYLILNCIIDIDVYTVCGTIRSLIWNPEEYVFQKPNTADYNVYGDWFTAL